MIMGLGHGYPEILGRGDGMSKHIVALLFRPLFHVFKRARLGLMYHL
jgi:hypothetical protein